MKYHYFYKITNNVNGKYYYGVHNTDNLEDGYMGSGKMLHIAYKKHGIENFKKEILKFFDTMDEAFEYEHKIVNEELVRDKQCYNIQIGGKYFNTENMVTVVDSAGNKFWVTKDEFLYSDKYKAIWKGKHHKEESRNKTREKMTPAVSKNDRVWVCKEGVVKYLLKKYLDEYLNNGWSLGRVGYKPRKNKQGTVIN